MIRFMPKSKTILWSLKSQRSFDGIEELKRFIAEKASKYKHYIGEEKHFLPSDVTLEILHDLDPFTGWRNYSKVILNGKVVGHCGEWI